MSERLYFIFGLTAFEIELKNRKPMVNHKVVKARANACNIVGQQDATLLSPTCSERLHTMLCVVACCCDFLEVVGQSLKLVKLQRQQVPTFLLFRGHRSVVQQCWVHVKYI